MFTIRSSGSIAQMIAEVRGIPARVIPYAASTALNRVAAKAALFAVPKEMQRVFDRPTPYALGGVNYIKANKDKLTATVNIREHLPKKVTAEDFLGPQVYGGARGEKRFERALRYAGLLPAGYRAMPGGAANLDAYGNVSRGETQRILTAVKGNFDTYQNKTNSAKSKKNARNAPYFVGKIHGTLGIWKRSGRTGPGSARPVFIFTSKQPTYRKRFDFHAVVQKTAEDNFKNEFSAAAAAILGR